MGKRYDQCDETCTVDCGHCKGQGKPADPTDVELVARVLRENERGVDNWDNIEVTEKAWYCADASKVLAALGPRLLPTGGVEREEERKDFERLISIGSNSWRPTIEVRTVTDFPDGSTLTGPWRPVTVKDEDQ